MKRSSEVYTENIPALLNQLENILRNSSKYSDVKFFFDFEVFNKIEQFYLDAIDDIEKISISKEDLKKSFCAYTGETVKHHVGGQWDICDVKNDPAYGTPIIIGWGKKGSDHVSISPYVWELLLLRNREKGDIAKMISRAYEREQKNN